MAGTPGFVSDTPLKGQAMQIPDLNEHPVVTGIKDRALAKTKATQKR